MNVSFNGIGEKFVTFLNNGAQHGQVVKISDDSTVSPCADGDRFHGVAAFAEPAFVGVRLGGFVSVPYTGPTPAFGYQKLSANGSGGVKTDANGTEFLVVSLDTSDQTVTFVL